MTKHTGTLKEYLKLIYIQMMMITFNKPSNDTRIFLILHACYGMENHTTSPEIRKGWRISYTQDQGLA